MKKLGFVFVFCLLCSCGDDDDKGTIIDILAGNENTSTLLTAVNTAGLADTLDGPGPFTVFAPVNSAFSELPEATLNALLANPDELADVLLFHVVFGNFKVEDLKFMIDLQTLEGSSLSITILEDDNLMIEDATIIKEDISAENGTVHLIDTVLINL